MDTKQVIVIRSDLKMRRGKEIAQGSHASMAFITNPALGSMGLIKLIINLIKLWFHKPTRQWMRNSFAKVCVRVESEAELRDIYQKAQTAGLYATLIIDSGRTEFDGVPTPTAVAIGPDEIGKINAITGGLKLY
jgi:PTH2 family peptidyl-tRNA hydrolase